MITLLAPLLALSVGAGAGEISAVVKDAEGKPVPDAVVFVYEAPGGKFKAPETPAVMDQVNLDFEPHVLAVQVGTKVKFPNKDKVHHHLYSFSKAKKFELPLYKGEDVEPVVMDKAGIVKLGCNIHDWMLGYILVLDNPYFAKTGADGRAVLSGVPAGSYKVAAWSERLKGEVEDFLQTIAVGEAPAKAAFKLALKPSRKPKRPAVTNY